MTYALRPLLLVVLAAGWGCSTKDGSEPSAKAPSKEPSIPAAAKGRAPSPEEAAVPARKSATDCLEKFETDRHRSVLNEHRGLGVSVSDFAKRYRAKMIDPDRFAAVETVKEYRIGDTPLLWFLADKSEAVVNAAVLSDLRVVELTALAVGETIEIGSLTELGRGKIAGREMLKFLIYSRTLGTYIHIGSQLCLAHEELSEAGYRARVSGSHTYFTSREHVEPIHFAFQLSAEGGLSVRSLDTSPVLEE